MSAKVLGRLDWSMTRDKDGHRDYKLKWLIETDSPLDGPVGVFNATGLPAIGSTFTFGNDVDAWAFCRPNAECSPVLTKEPNRLWTLTQNYSTRPIERDQTDEKTDPLLEPDRVSGSFVKYVKEITKDRNGDVLKTSSHELLKGPLLEFDHNRPTVKIGKSLATLPLATFSEMVDTVNDATLWGLSARMIKLSNVSWQRKYYQTSTVYYTVDYEFDIDFTTFDRKAVDQGTKVLAAGGNANNPEDFEVYKDANGENTTILLDGNGAPLGNAASPVEIDIEYYAESDFTLLGIPTSL